ncbi:5'/3'-nucleotidase SurE [Cryptococcus gattii VGV]|nr:5'/3'-nucleotidase SurE [Cryptococcus gattii VGV]
MPPLETYGKRPVVLLTNDDGPPCDASPNIYSFAKALERQLGWDVRVVIPDSQKSWVGKAYAINDVITASYFYPQEPDGRTGEVSPHPRPLKQGESMEWVLLSGTPSSCANIALHNLYPGQIDLVISGPNHGRNSSTAFALSSGTVGATLAATLSVPLPGPPAPAPALHTEHVPCIALSYAVVSRPIAPRLLDLAAETSVDVCKKLFDNWAHDSAPGRAGKVQIYSVNVPLVEQYLEKGNRKAVYTELWKSAYGDHTHFDPGDDPDQGNKNKTTEHQPNKPQAAPVPSHTKTSDGTPGPAALPTPSLTPAPTPTTAQTPQQKQLKFRFDPNLQPVLFPREDTLTEGTDAWALAKGYVSVTPLRAEYNCVPVAQFGSELHL